MRRLITGIRLCSHRLILSSLVVLLFLQAHAQVSTRITSVSPSDAVSDRPVTMVAELQQGETIERVYFVYRTFGESEWMQREMDLLGNTASVRVPQEDVRPPYLEYYIVLVNRMGVAEAYPFNDSQKPLTSPPSRTLQLPIINKEDDLQAVFLSPDPNANVTPEDVVISVSLLRADTIVVRRATQLLLDGADVSQSAVLSDDLLIYVPENVGQRLKPGRHRAAVRLYDRNGVMHRQVSTTFTVVGEGEKLDVAPNVFIASGSVDVELRQEKVGNVRTSYNRGGMRFTGSQGNWRFLANLFLTSDEQPDRQPQNRYSAALQSDWLLIGYGDSYPNFPNLILNGKRVRGLNTSLHLGKFNVDLALGTTVRDIEGALIKRIPASQLQVEQQADPYAAFSKIDSITWGKYSYGTYARDVFAIRPSFGSGEKYQIGFTWLKAKDDVTSIQFGTRPQENLVLGTDFISKFDKNRVELSAQAAFSAYNSDISSGNFTDAYIDSVYKKDATTIKSARDILKHFITVNDNLRPLSFKNLSTFAYDVSLALNYFDNSFKATYLFRGSDYTSFGQTFLRKDIAGFNLLDRIRLTAYNVYITLGVERLTDNTSKSKATTTRFTTINAAASYEAGGPWPGVTFGYTRYVNRNDLTNYGRDSMSAVDDQTNRYYALLSHRLTFLAAHSVSVSYSHSQRNDNSILNADVRNSSLSLNVLSRFAPLQT
ncbi:MAG: hypothetical protein HY961_17340, partial [Ignavibacteriae bacterium]|nr:hypothetical protein [Ignavibacteriota bacterium]